MARARLGHACSRVTYLQPTPRYAVLRSAPLVATSRSSIAHCRHNAPRSPIKTQTLTTKASSNVSLRANHSSKSRSILIFTLAIALFGVLSFTKTTRAEAPSGNVKPIRLTEVRKHGAKADRKWVIKGNKVYDITEWIDAHPGGEVILRAAGGTVDRYWDIFTIHKKKEVYDVLDSFYIGDVDPQDLTDGKVPNEEVQDPFATDPERDKDLIILSDRPCNAETSLDHMQSFITPSSHFYVRNHLWVPDTNETTHSLSIELPDGETKSYTLEDLRSKFRSTTLTATLQCSGNRRRNMSDESRSTSGLQWNVGAISNASWTGVRLRDVLADAGFDSSKVDDDDDIQHVHFSGAEAYSASIPLGKALNKHGDVILAYEMNGAPLPPDHGFPLRAIVPGTVAARSVKWLTGIKLSDEESQSQWQQRDYKCFGPNQGGKDVDWASAPAIQETPVQSAITSLQEISSHSPTERQTLRVYGLEEDAIKVSGYAISGGGRRIVRVDVSADNGRNWHQAELLPQQLAKEESRRGGAWAWTRWEWVVPKREVGRGFAVKAVDESYNVQPGEYEPHYNFRGNLTNAWHRVPYTRGP